MMIQRPRHVKLGETPVYDLDGFSFCVYDEVLGLDVSMKYPATVNVVQALSSNESGYLRNLEHVLPYLLCR